VKRVNDFRTLLTTPSGKAEHPETDEARTLVLTADELNAYIQKNAEFRGKFYATIADGKVRAQVSLPLDQLPGLKGRYLNGEGDLLLSGVAGEPVVKLRDLRVKGMPLPAQLRAGIEDINLAARHRDPDDADSEPKPIFARKLEKLEVKDGTLVIV